jgi:hypothetical protein
VARRREFSIIGEIIEDENRRVVATLKPGLPLSSRCDLQDALKGRKAWRAGYEDGLIDGKEQAFKEEKSDSYDP